MSPDIRVLYVDDDPALCDLTAEFLERVSPTLAVTVESDPTEVPDRLDADADPDCIVSDYEMPQLDGLALYRRIHPDRPTIPFFLFTSRSDEALVERAARAGVTGVVHKRTGVDHYERLARQIVDAVARTRDGGAVDAAGSGLGTEV